MLRVHRSSGKIIRTRLSPVESYSKPPGRIALEEVAGLTIHQTHSWQIYRRLLLNRIERADARKGKISRMPPVLITDQDQYVLSDVGWSQDAISSVFPCWEPHDTESLQSVYSVGIQCGCAAVYWYKKERKRRRQRERQLSREAVNNKISEHQESIVTAF